VIWVFPRSLSEVNHILFVPKAINLENLIDNHLQFSRKTITSRKSGKIQGLLDPWSDVWLGSISKKCLTKICPQFFDTSCLETDTKTNRLDCITSSVFGGNKMTINKLILSAVPLTLYQRPSRSSQCLLKQRMMEALMVLTEFSMPGIT